MKILIYDNNIEDLKKFYEMLKLYPFDITIHKALDKSDALNKFNTNTYEKVFIDFSDEVGKSISQAITNIKPAQEVFLLHERFDCAKDLITCQECKKNFDKNSIIKPLIQSQLTNIMNKNFFCEKFGLTKDEFILEKIKKEVHIKYPYLKFQYEKEKNSFLAESLPTYALVYVTDLLSQYEIDFYVSHDSQIIIQ